MTSGIRLGTPAGTTRGFGIAEFRQVGDLIVEVLDVLSQKAVEEDSLVEAAVREQGQATGFPVPDLPGLSRVDMIRPMVTGSCSEGGECAVRAAGRSTPR